MKRIRRKHLARLVDPAAPHTHDRGFSPLMSRSWLAGTLFVTLAAVLIQAQMGPPSAAIADGAPPQLRATPDSLVYGHASNAYLQIIAAGHFDGDPLGDLIVGELPPGTGGGERTETNVLLGRATWPERTGTEGLGLRKIVEPVQGELDSFAILGSGDLNGDGRDDLFSIALKQAGRPNQSMQLGLHWSAETMPGRPNLSRPDVSLEVRSDDVPHFADSVDVNGDGHNDLVVTGEEGVDIVLGRSPWPSRLPLEPPDVHIGPGPVTATFGDTTGNGISDLWLSFDADGIDAAFLAGRASWPRTIDATTDGDVRLGAGSRDVGGAIVPDVSGDGVADVLRIDHIAGSFEVFHGRTDIVARLSNRLPDWSVRGVADTWEIPCMDLTGDGVAEVLVNRRAVLLGREGRSGAFDIDAGEYDADWSALGFGSLWSLDVDGQRGDDVLVSDSSADARGREGAGSISIFLSPLFTPIPPTTRPPTVTATSTTSPSDTPMPTVVMSPSPTTRAPEGDHTRWIPVAWAPGR